jgi:hypothetical protein
MSAPIVEERRPTTVRLVGFGLLFGLVACGLATFSAFPWLASAPDAALLKVTFQHVAAFERAGRQLSAEELAKLPRHMRPQGGVQAATGRRASTHLALSLDGRGLLARRYRPGGFREDGPTFAYEELAMPLGAHRLEAVLADGDDAATGRRWQLDQAVVIRPGQVLRLELAEDVGLVLR